MNETGGTIVPLRAPDRSLQLVGGKARSLMRLAEAQFPVPEGFVISTSAYRQFVASSELRNAIAQVVTDGSAEHPQVEQASKSIRSRMNEAMLPSGVKEELCQAYHSLAADGVAVAVRSSATAEDLPELSFAGQQDTYLNVRGDDELITAVRQCWASLWSPRAILYRRRSAVDQQRVAMAVIVQRMVNAEVSGILFTANPATGDRSELVVNASYGLGEAVVGGEVNPDNIRLDRDTHEIKEQSIGDKEVMVVCSSDQGTATQTVSEQQRGRLALTQQALRELSELSLRAEKLFDGVPQDIEWAVANDHCWLLQSRPITNLPDAPLAGVRWDPPRPGTKLIRRQVVENMPDPLSPLFAELYLQVGLEQAIDHMVDEWNIPCDMDNLIERPFFLTVNGYAYSRASYRSFWRLMRSLPGLLYWYAVSVPRMLKSVVPNWRDKGLPTYLAKVQQWRSVDPSAATNQQLLEGIRDLAIADACYWMELTTVLATAKITDGMLNRFLNSWIVRSPFNSGNFLRGFPSPSLQAQLDLEAIAARVRQQHEVADRVLNTPPADLLPVIRDDANCHSLRSELEDYLLQYGHQIYTLDFVQPTQADHPLPVLQGLQKLVRDESYDTAARQAELVQQRESQIAETLGALGPLRRWVFRKLLGWAQDFGPYREEAMFYLGSGWPTLRSFALELGRRLENAGALETADDIFYLTSDELTVAWQSPDQDVSDYASLARDRKRLRRQQQRLHPPGMIPEKSKFKIGPIDFSSFETQKRNAQDTDTLEGFPVSPGAVRAEASVILSPNDFGNMKPNSILVCPTTTPAWTPLFSQAVGLATDIGGILAHGSIVAREYGIPAVMGTGNVTQRVRDGQELTVDGDAGTVTLH